MKKSTASSASFLPLDRPRILLFISFASVLACLALSKTFFPDLGPPPERINSPIAAQRWLARVTLFEIAFLRVLLLVIAIFSALTWLKWETVKNSRFVAKVSARSPYPLPDDNLFNQSFKVLAAATAAFLIGTGLGSIFPAILPPIVVIEDGLVEYLTAFLFIPCAILAFLLARSEPVRRRRYVFYFMSFGFVFCLGEEISWGQRIFEYATPQPLTAINAQGEANLHNSFGYAADHIFRVVVLVFCVLIPLLAHRNGFFHRLFDYTGIPLASVGLAVGFLFSMFLENWTVYKILPETHLR